MKGKSELVSLEAAGAKENSFLFFLSQIGLLALSTLLFALAFPSFLSLWGWYPLAFISIAPVFVAVHRSSLKGTFF